MAYTLDDFIKYQSTVKDIANLKDIEHTLIRMLDPKRHVRSTAHNLLEQKLSEIYQLRKVMQDGLEVPTQAQVVQAARHALIEVEQVTKRMKEDLPIVRNNETV